MAATQPALSLEFGAATDVGCRRSNNEDSLGHDDARQIYAICDGMGGAEGGEIASATAVDAFLGCFSQLSDADPNGPIEQRLLESIEAANRAVRSAAAGSGRLQGMGTTLVFAAFEGSRLVIGNVGDSRGYFSRTGQFSQITEDHSFVAEQVSRGWMTEEEAASSALQSMITRALGAEDHVEPDLFEAELAPGDVVLLCSDGLTRHVSDAEIAEAMESGGSPESICCGLIAAAKQRGGVDNITCIVLRVTAA